MNKDHSTSRFERQWREWAGIAEPCLAYTMLSRERKDHTMTLTSWLGLASCTRLRWAGDGLGFLPPLAHRTHTHAPHVYPPCPANTEDPSFGRLEVHRDKKKRLSYDRTRSQKCSLLTFLLYDSQSV